jgi:hypothetical protein
MNLILLYSIFFLFFQHFKRRNLASTNEQETPTSFGVAGPGTPPAGPTESVRIIFSFHNGNYSLIDISLKDYFFDENFV